MAALCICRIRSRCRPACMFWGLPRRSWSPRVYRSACWPLAAASRRRSGRGAQCAPARCDSRRGGKSRRAVRARSSRASISACAACRARCYGCARTRCAAAPVGDRHLNYRHAFHAGSFADVHKHAVLARILHYLCEKPARLPRHRHPCRRRALRSRRSGSAAQRRMARRHRAADGRVARRAGGGAAGALSRGDRRAQRARQAHDLSRLAGDRARLLAPAGPADRLRIGAAGRRRACRATCAAIRASRPSPSTAGPRCRLICRRRSAAAWCWSIRRSSRRAISPNSPTASRMRIANGRPASTCCGTRSRGAAQPDALAKRLRRLGIAKLLRSELIVAPLSDPSRLNGSGLIVVNPPWTLEKELACCCRRSPICCAAKARAATGWIGLPASARRPAVDDSQPLSTDRELVSSSNTGSDVPPPLVGGRRSD